ncbi:MAG: DUF4301 family protein [Bacteroidaceae bacterium]|nr:DUF4301 family protein [Bacteroidaceae bacterium]
MYSQEDLKTFASRGVSEEKINEQLACFATGFPYLKLSASASIGNGILAIDKDLSEKYLTAWNEYLADNHRIVKFVPASGAASRMFKNLFEFIEAEYDTPTTDFEKKFFDNIDRFAFYDALNDACIVLYGKTIDDLTEEGNYKEVVAALLGEDGLNYGALPKGLLQFHTYNDQVRTAMEEHLAEGALYAGNAARDVNVHFTVSHDHMPLFKDLVEQVLPEYENDYNVHYHISFSEQKPSTDTIAADMENRPFRDSDGSLLFRPGGHGALIENLNDIEADVIFVKNIDNVVPDRLKEETVLYKKIIGGVLVTLKKQIDGYVAQLKSGNYTAEDLQAMASFLENSLYNRNEAISSLDNEQLAAYLLKKFDRPLRVCGMVKNVGEPGGGPFLAYNQDGTVSLQILESSQIDMNNAEAKALFEKGTHFNPVDLVCAVCDGEGKKYNLPSFVDKNTGFISYKSKSGKELKALELPGLWNGAMSDWNTLFVEVPIETFNPVKTVNDLLREQHQ